MPGRRLTVIAADRPRGYARERRMGEASPAEYQVTAEREKVRRPAGYSAVPSNRSVRVWRPGGECIRHRRS
ncbi:MAG: hypothetical protein BWY76_02797 [bacterium ADurb.Bin429]|nr:MAG: hypothetical protein BWY76_02797 [bacterium ADurb.Bin429]